MLLVVGVPGTREIILIESNKCANNNTEIFWVDTIVTVSFGIGIMECRAILYLPVNSIREQLSGVILIQFQQQFCGAKI